MVGNWYCVPSSCGRVVWREYLPPVVRWRYPGEEWNEIEADDYFLDEIIKPCPGQPHELNYGRQNVLSPKSSCTRTDITVFAPLRDWQGHTNAPFTNLRISVPTRGINQIYPDPLSAPQVNLVYCGSSSVRTYVYVTDNLGIERELVNTAGYGFVFFNFRVEPNFVQNCPLPDCIFTVTKNGTVVYEETRSVCPEVEKLPCRLSDTTKQIIIKKVPFLERIEVVDYGIFGYSFDSSVQGNYRVNPYDIPDECLNIFLNPYTAPTLYGAPDNSVLLYGYIKQICSASGCPPPEYEVICDCDCESCPENTCPVECGDHICCYDNDGIAVKSIPIDNYCGD